MLAWKLQHRTQIETNNRDIAFNYKIVTKIVTFIL